LVGTGGTERVVSTLSQLLSERFDVFEFSFDSPGSARCFDSPAEFVPLGPSIGLPLFIRPISYALDAFRLWRAKRRFGISLTISNLWRADLLNIISMGTDRKVSICHINIVGNTTNRLLLRFRGLVSLVYRRFDKVVSVSRPLGEEICSLFRLDGAKSCVIHNCVLPRTTEYLEKVDRRIRIAWCGRFVAEKNVLTLIAIFASALKSNSALQLVMIGDGPLCREAAELIEKLSLRIGSTVKDLDSDVILTGFVRDPVPLMAACDFQVLPSIAEGLGLVLIEGFLVGIPALASDCSGGGVHDAMGGARPFRAGRIEPEQTVCGYLLPVPEMTLPTAMEVWRTHMLLMAGSPELRKRLAAGARQRAGMFLPKSIGPQWLKLIGEIL